MSWIPRRRWQVQTAGWHTPTLFRLFSQGWEPIAFGGGIYALRKRVWNLPARPQNGRTPASQQGDTDA